MNDIPFLDFFAGSGLVAEGLKPNFNTVWANDVSPRKAAVYCANHSPEPFFDRPIEDVNGRQVPTAVLAWASFPCVDLSLAGKMEGINARRSGLVWHWLRVIDEMKEKPPLLVVENVTGLVSADGGKHYRALHAALVRRGYKVGPMILDAVRWLPHSRPRVFAVAVEIGMNTKGLRAQRPNWAHPNILQKAVKGLKRLVWWKLPEPLRRTTRLSDLIQYDAPYDDEETTKRNLRLIPPKHRERLVKEIEKGLRVAPGYKRIRSQGQVLELRFDDVAGCLRTPQGGSSRQYLVLPNENGLHTRLLTVRETARLMGAPESYNLPGSYNDGYAAMGDAVATPVTRHLAENLLAPLAERV